MNTRIVPIGELRTDARNVRRHPPENLAAIKASLQQFGQVLPLVVHEGTVIGGNGTLACMRELGFREAAVVDYTGTEDGARALAIALNRSAEQAVWDTEALGLALGELAEAGYEPEALGFSASALEALFPAPDEVFSVAPPAVEAQERSSEEAGERATQQPVVQYAIIFDDTAQQRRFYDALRVLKTKYPEQTTSAARLDRLLQEALAPA